MENPALPHLIYRIDAVEKMQAVHNQQYTDLKVEMGTVKHELAGVREQAKAHSEASSRAISELRDQFNATLMTTQSLIANTGRDLQQAIDAIGGWLGVEDAKAGKALRQNLEYLSDYRSRREKWRDRMDNYVIAAMVGGACIILALGFKVWIQ